MLVSVSAGFHALIVSASHRGSVHRIGVTLLSECIGFHAGQCMHRGGQCIACWGES